MLRTLHAIVAATAMGILGLMGVSSAGIASDDVLVSVNTNMARVLRINAPAATVIVGNPAIADVTIQDPQTLILTGKSYGRTNMIILDAMGDPIADTVVEVTQIYTDTVTMLMGGDRISLACAPHCQPAIMLGDNPSYTTQVISSSAIVSQAAR